MKKCWVYIITMAIPLTITSKGLCQVDNTIQKYLDSLEKLHTNTAIHSPHSLPQGTFRNDKPIAAKSLGKHTKLYKETMREKTSILRAARAAIKQQYPTTAGWFDNDLIIGATDANNALQLFVKSRRLQAKNN